MFKKSNPVGLANKLRVSVVGIVRLMDAITKIEAAENCLDSFAVVANVFNKDFVNRTNNFEEKAKAVSKSRQEIESVLEEEIAKNTSIFAEVCDDANEFESIFRIPLPADLTAASAVIVNTVFLKRLRERIKSNFAESKPEDVFELYIDIISRELSGENFLPDVSGTTCPSCGGKATLRPGSDYDVRFDCVYGCDCGNWAQVDKNGEILGVPSNDATHEARGEIVKIVLSLMSVFGCSIYEAYRAIGRKTHKSILERNDLEKLTLEECNNIKKWYHALTIMG
jgi:hypothetical protein